MDYSKLTDQKLQIWKKQIKVQLEILQEQEDAVYDEIHKRYSDKLATKLQENLINFINS